MQQQIAVITLGVDDLSRSSKFYQGGFGWKSAFENDQIVFYQMNGFVLGAFLKDALAEDANRNDFATPGAFALAHNVRDRDDVTVVIEKLIAAGGRLLREADEPPHGGFRGYVADPDNHTWEIAHNPAFGITDEGYVKFGL